MEIRQPYNPDTPQPPVVCPPRQPDGYQVTERVCLRTAHPDSSLATQLRGYSPCQEVGHCVRAYVAALLVRQGTEEEKPAGRQAW